MSNKKSQSTKVKTLRLKTSVIDEIQQLADDSNRNFNNMAETLLMEAAKKRLAM